MRNIFSSRTTSPSTSSHPSPLHNHHHRTFSDSLIEENLEIAEAIINKWNPEGSNYTTVSYLFADNPREAKDFLKSVADLQSAMHFFVSQQHVSSAKMIHAQNLMQIAMKRLEKEFYQILSANRAQLDSESISAGRSSHASENSRTSTSDYEEEIGSEDETHTQADSLSEIGEAATVAMSDLRSIAECMTAAGYGKECVKIYKIIRKSIVDEGLYHLGIEKFTQAQINKLNWDVLESKIKNWVHGMKVAVKTIFSGERILCDFVFSGNDAIRESCFNEITREGANMLFSFPELVAKAKKAPERMFRILDLYDSISEHWPEIELIFAFESTAVVRSQAVSSLIKLGDAVRSLLIDFEAAIQKDSSKAAVPGGGIHPLTRYVMNYICFLSDYSGVLNDITADWPLPEKQNLPETYLDSASDDSGLTSVISIRFQWLILVLLCKLDGKTELFKDVSLSYLFLANNLNYIISKVAASNLKFLLGQEWIFRHKEKVTQYSYNYIRMGWNKALSSLPENNATIQPEQVEGYFQRFSSAFETTYRSQSSWVVSDGKLRDDIKTSLCKTILPVYKAFYDKYQGQVRHREKVRYTPEDLGNYLSDLLYGNGISRISGSDSSSRGSSHSR